LTDLEAALAASVHRKSNSSFRVIRWRCLVIVFKNRKLKPLDFITNVGSLDLSRLWLLTTKGDLKQRGVSVRVGMEATGYSRWFERLLAELGIEVWIGDAAEIKTKRVRKQKTDRQDAQLLLKLLLENKLSARVGTESRES